MQHGGIPLSSTQAVTIHGWINPQRRLHWATVMAREDLTFLGLFKCLSKGSTYPLTAGGQLGLDLLFSLQPDFRAWVVSKKAFLGDCEAMHHRWTIDLNRDFGVGRVR